MKAKYLESLAFEYKDCNPLTKEFLRELMRIRNDETKLWVWFRKAEMITTVRNKKLFLKFKSNTRKWLYFASGAAQHRNVTKIKIKRDFRKEYFFIYDNTIMESFWNLKHFAVSICYNFASYTRNFPRQI